MLKTLSPTAKRIARAAITIPAMKTKEDTIDRNIAGYFRTLKQQHIF